MIFAVFDVSVNACRRYQVYKLMFYTFLFHILLQKQSFYVGG